MKRTRMGGIPESTRRILQAANLWETPCLICGSLKRPSAEHALKFAGKNINAPPAILPLCLECNHAAAGWKANAGAIKRQSEWLAVQVWMLVYRKLGELPCQYHNLSYTPAAVYGIDERMVARMEVWARRLGRECR